MEKNEFLDESKFKIQSFQDTIILTPKNEDYLRVLIFYIGFGDSVLNFSKIFTKLAEKLEKTKIILLGPSKISVTAMKNDLYHSWYNFKYNILSTLDDNVCESDLDKLIPKTKNIVNSELKLSKDVYLSGFSQGGSVAFHLGNVLISFLSIKGIILFSGFCLNMTNQILVNNSKTKNSLLKIILFHGVLDETIPKESSIEIKNSLDQLNKENYNYEIIYKEFRCDHTITIEEMKELNEILNK